MVGVVVVVVFCFCCSSSFVVVVVVFVVVVDDRWLLNVQATCCFLRDGSAQTSLHAATLRLKLQIQLAISHPVPVY